MKRRPLNTTMSTLAPSVGPASATRTPSTVNASVPAAAALPEASAQAPASKLTTTSPVGQTNPSGSV